MKILNKILKDVGVVETRGDLQINISGIEYDSRKVKKGSVFIAINGFDKNGTIFIDDAIKNGAVAIVSEESANTIDFEGAIITTSNSRETLAVLSANFFEYPSKEIGVIGITGTNGKTTTAMIIDSILRASGRKSGVISTIDYRFNNTLIPSTRTTPESVELQKIFRELADNKINNCVIEVSSHALELYRVYKTYFTVGVFTNLTQDHLDFHKNEEEYFKAKLKLFTDYNLKKAVINIDDPYGRLICKETKAEIITIGIKEKGDIRAEDIKLSSNGINFSVKTLNGDMEIHSKLIGLHNIYNILCTIGVGFALGLSIDDIKEGVNDLKNVPGRFEKIDAGQNFTIIIDYAHTDDALKNALKAAKEFIDKRIILVFGCGGGRDKGKRQKMGEVAGKYADYSIITSDNPRNEDTRLIMAEVEKGIKKTAENDAYCLISDREKAIQRAIELAKKDDIVIIAGKGHEKYQIVGNQHIEFDDCEVTRKILKKII